MALTWFPAPVSSVAASSTPGGFTTSSESVPPASSPAATPAAGVDPASAFQQLASDLQSLLLQLQSQDGTADPSAATPTAADTPAQIAGTDQGDNANPQVRPHHGHHHHAAAPASADQGSSTPANSVDTAAKTFAQDFLKAIQSYTGTADNVANPATLVAAA